MTDETQEIPPPSGRIGPWLFLAAIVLAVFLYTLLKPAGLGEHSSAIGGKLEQLRLEPLTGGGQAAGLHDLAGRVTVINFWGTWCPPCVVEFPHVVALDRRFRQHEAFQLFAVSCESGRGTELAELAEETAAFLQQREAELPTYADPEMVSRLAVANVLGEASFGYPTTLVLDRSGVIRGAWTGYKPGLEREIEALVEELLGDSKT